MRRVPSPSLVSLGLPAGRATKVDGDAGTTSGCATQPCTAKVPVLTRVSSDRTWYDRGESERCSLNTRNRCDERRLDALRAPSDPIQGSRAGERRERNRLSKLLPFLFRVCGSVCRARPFAPLRRDGGASHRTVPSIVWAGNNSTSVITTTQ